MVQEALSSSWPSPSSTSSLHKAKYPRTENSSLQNFWQQECFLEVRPQCQVVLTIWEKGALFRICSVNANPKKEREKRKKKKNPQFESCPYLSLFKKIIIFKGLNVLNRIFSATKDLAFYHKVGICQTTELYLNGPNFVSWQPECTRIGKHGPWRKIMLLNIYELQY